jgi:peptidoglycan/LPS O-acetylase OafA/YrhL
MGQTIATRLFYTFGIIFVSLCVLLVRLNPQIFISDATEVFVLCILFYCLLHLTSLQRPSLFANISTKISEMSYTLYLCHAPILVFLCALIMAPHWQPWVLSPLGLAKFAGVICVTFLCARFMYELFERNTSQVRQFVYNILSKRG